MPHHHRIRWSQADHDTGLLLEYLEEYMKKHDRQFTAIAFVARGGGVPGTIVAYALGIHWVDTIVLKSYQGQTQGEVVVEKDIHPATAALVGEGSQNLLIVEDLTDRGETLKKLRDLHPKATIIAPYSKHNPGTAGLLDAWAVMIPGSTWYDLPWSRREKGGGHTVNR